MVPSAIKQIVLKRLSWLYLFNPDTLLKLIYLLLALCVGHHSCAMILVLLPLPIIDLTIRPSINALSLLQVTNEFSLVCPTIWVSHHAFAMLLVFLPVTNVIFAVFPGKGAFAVEHIIFPEAIIHVLVGPFVDSNSIFNTTFEVTFVIRTSVKILLAMTMWLIILPLSFVGYSLCLIDKFTLTVGLILNECSFVDIFIWMDNFALSFHLIVYPFSFVFSSVIPILFAVSMSLLGLKTLLSECFNKLSNEDFSIFFNPIVILTS
jgi:hypothetical protein